MAGKPWYAPMDEYPLETKYGRVVIEPNSSTMAYVKASPADPIVIHGVAYRFDIEVYLIDGEWNDVRPDNGQLHTLLCTFARRFARLRHP